MIGRMLAKEWFLGLVLAAMMIPLASGEWLSRIDGALFDLGRSLTRVAEQPTGEIAIIEVDRASMKRLGGAGQERAALARLLEKLRPLHSHIALLMPLDQRYNNPTTESLEPLRQYVDSASLPKRSETALKSMLATASASLDGDSQLAVALRKVPQLILPDSSGKPDSRHGSEGGIAERLSRFVIRGLSPLQPVPAVTFAKPDPMFAGRAELFGTLSLLADGNGRVRGLSLLEGSPDEPRVSIPLLLAADDPQSVSAVSAELAYDNITLPVGSSRQGYLHSYGAPFQMIPLARVLDRAFDTASLNNKRIIIADELLMHRQLMIDGGEFLSIPEIIGLATANLRNHDLVTTSDAVAIAEWMLFLVTALTMVLLLPRLRYVFGAAVASVAVLAMALASVYMVLTAQLWFKSAMPISMLFVDILIIGLLRLYRSQHSRNRSELFVAYRQLGLAYQEQGKKEQAFEAFKQLPAEDEHIELIYNLALDFERQRRYERAAAVYHYILNLNPSFRDAARRKLKAEKLGEAILTGNSHSHALLMMPDEEGLMPKLGRYQVDKEIGKGAMGAVYLGRDPKIDRTVAIKTLALSQEFESNELKHVEERFFHEAAAAGKLNHPNIVTIYDAGEEHDLAFIAMELVSGRPLSDYVESGKLLPVNTVLEIIAQVADGLHYAAAAGVIHRDIKPANIMFDDRSGVVKITDFGIARITTSNRTKTGTILGTPSYMSPEQISTKRVDGRSDIFSLGATMFMLLTGVKPFAADSLAGMTFQITSEKHPDIMKIRPELPSCIKPVIDRSLQKDPDKRYQDGKAMRRAILRCMKSLA